MTLGLLPAILILVFAIKTSAEQKSPPQVWMANMRPEALVENGAQWDFVKRHVDVCQDSLEMSPFWTH